MEKIVEIAKNIFWVGAVLKNDPFQCHVYLINNGDESVLIDPGSIITFDQTLKKISQITELKNIKYLICHHQDPDITSCIAQLEKLIDRKDKFIVTHWRVKALLKHYNWKTDFYLIEENNWELKLKNNRLLKFIFTPYAHFPGAFCTYDTLTKTLFSSDIFGGFTEEFSLFAKDENYFENIKAFHEHYMPSKEILNHAMNEIEKFDINLIAPQHGSIIKKSFIKKIIKKVRELNCGLYLLTKKDSQIQYLIKTNTILKGIFDTFTKNINLVDILENFKILIKELLPIEDIVIEAFPKWFDKKIIFYTKIKSYIEAAVKDKRDFSELLEVDLKDSQLYSFPLINIENILIGNCILIFKKEPNALLDTEFLERIQQFSLLFAVSLERELKFIAMQEEKDSFLKLAIEDGLTGLYNRYYLKTVADKEFKKAKRYNYPLSVIIFDIDFFKKVNDKYGHLAGDYVLKEVAKIIKNNLRDGDIPIRYGGEELVVMLPFISSENAFLVAERIRKDVEKKEIRIADHIIKITISGGVASLNNENSLEELIKKADEKLYIAKKSGRNKIVI